MARLTIEDKWWTDPRRSRLIKLLGGEDQADMAALRLWKLAQQFWGSGKQLIPLEMFEVLEGARELVEARLAIIDEDRVYVRGSGEFLSWLHEKREQAKTAGEKSAEARKRRSGTAQPSGGKGHKSKKKSERNPNGNRTDPNGSEPSGSGSDSGSGFDSDSGTNLGFDFAADATRENSRATVQPVPTKTQAFIAHYKARFFERHGVKVDFVGKDAGIAKRLAESLSEARAARLLDAYFQMPDSYVVKAKHPLELFELKLKEIGVFADSGNFVTRRQAVQADDMASNMILLEQVRRGQA